MTGGSLNLSSTQGTGDDILNINPQITFFKKVYKRHTNFGLETKEITDSSNSNVNFGERVIYNITKTGSLINDMHFEFTLPPTKNDGGNDGVVDGSDKYCCWVNAVGYAIINEIKLEIDGNIIDRQTGLWYDIWNELTDPNRKEWSLVGKRNDNVDEETQQINKSRYYVPLKFYFNRNPGLSFPIFLLDENKIKVNIVLNSLNNLIRCDQDGNTNITINARPITSFKFFTTYVFLDKAEENRIKMNLPNEYLVETLDTHDNLRESDLSNIVLSNPVKELIWVIRNRRRLEVATTSDIPEINVRSRRPKDRTNEFTNDKFNYALHTLNNNLDYGSYDTFKTLNIQIGNKSRVDATEATFFRTIQPFKHHSNVPGGIDNNEKRKYIYVYSFALNPEEYQPSGSYNFTKGDEKVKLIFTGIGQSATNNNNDLTGYRLDLFAFHYKLLSVYDGRIEFKDVPYSSEIKIDPVSEDPNMKGVEPEIVRQIAKKKCRERTEIAIAEEEKRLIAIEEEVRRRYSAKKPDVHRHQNFHKKKWAGLQGQQ